MVAKNVRQVALYLTAEQRDALHLLHDATRIPRSVLLREAVDDLLEKYRNITNYDTADAIMPPVQVAKRRNK